MKRLLVIVACLSIAVWIVGFVNGKREAARRERLLSQALTLERVSYELSNIAIPSKCPLLVLAANSVNGGSQGPYSLEVSGIEVTNNSHSDLLSYQIEWTVYRVGDKAARLTAVHVPKPFGTILPGESDAFDKLHLAADAKFGFKEVSGRLSYARFADGTSCQLAEPPDVQYDSGATWAF
jgi:hypothetical protein